MTERRNRRVLYGRRLSRPLRAGRKRLLDTVLPALSIDLSNQPLDDRTLFGRTVPDIWLEIGFGGGEHLAAQARARPDVGFLGCEPFLNGVSRLLSEIDRENIENIRLHAGDARDVIDALPEASVGRAFLLFPDPWPKARHHRRRFVSRENLDALARIMRDGAILRMASDHMDYVRWMLFHTVAHPAFEWLARGPEDWRTRPGDWPETRYEAKALAQGDSCVYLAFRRRARERAGAGSAPAGKL